MNVGCETIFLMRRQYRNRNEKKKKLSFLLFKLIFCVNIFGNRTIHNQQNQQPKTQQQQQQPKPTVKSPPKKK